MSRHLLAIGRRAPGATIDDFLMNEVDERVSRLGGLVVARCDRPSDLVQLVSYHGEGRGLVDRLDIFDHGGPGLQLLGDGVLFRSADTVCAPFVGQDIAEALRPHLSEVAQVRLLGCLTANALSDEGRLLLINLSKVLGGHRVVFGTIDKVDGNDFGPGGFDSLQEPALLFSSLAALDGVAPTRAARDAQLAGLSTVLC